MSAEEQRKLEERRNKNKEAAQRCRTRRMEKIESLESRVKILNEELSNLRTLQDKFKIVPDQLSYFLSQNNHVCCLAATPPATIVTMTTMNGSVSSKAVPPVPQSFRSQADFDPSSSQSAPKRPQFLSKPLSINKPLTNIVREDKRPSSQPSPNVTIPFTSLNTPGLGTPIFSDNNFLGTPGLPSFSQAQQQLPSFNLDTPMFLEDRTPSRDVAASVLCNALDLQSTYPLETPNTETPRHLTAL